TDVYIQQYVAFGRVISIATLLGVVNVVIITALSTIMAFLYNIVAALASGVHLTLTDDCRARSAPGAADLSVWLCGARWGNLKRCLRAERPPGLSGARRERAYSSDG